MPIVSAESYPEFLEELRSLFLEEWEKIDPFNGNEFRSNPPSPLLALENNMLAGGLSFTWYCPEGFSNISLWINAVLVKPDYRGAGVATALINEAAISAAKTSESELFTYTQIPRLYTQLGWEIVSCKGNDHVLKTTLASHP